ncbi:MAG TPA: YciI family protein [Candidatus Acidoferrum sp.]|nr:YciI family protein [Candidatus Acidoferrum sp.]
MRFMMLVKSTENSGPPPKELMDAIAKLAADTTRAGTMIETGGLAPSAMSTRVRLSEGKLTSLDGPFAETRELVGGYAIFEFNSKQEAVESALVFMELHRKHWPGWEGETEIRQIFTMPDYTCESGSLELKKHSASGT